MFIRFVIHKNDQQSGRRQGLFQAMSDLEHAGVLLMHEQRQYDEIYDWFRQHLRKPRSFARSSKPHAKDVALSWYRDTAVNHLQKMRGIARILEDHGVAVDVLYSARPGYIVYEDEFQVAAEPFKDTTT